MSSRLFSQPVTVQRVEMVPGVGSRPVPLVVASIETRCAWQSNSSLDSDTSGLMGVSEIVAYLPPDVEVNIGDRLVKDGESYQVVSLPLKMRSFARMKHHHTTVRARRDDR